MKNYSSNVASPDQVKQMIDEVDQRQSEEIAALQDTVKVIKFAVAALIISVVAGGAELIVQHQKLDNHSPVAASEVAASK